MRGCKTCIKYKIYTIVFGLTFNPVAYLACAKIPRSKPPKNTYLFCAQAKDATNLLLLVYQAAAEYFTHTH